MDLTLVAGTAGNYSLYDDEEQLILRGRQPCRGNPGLQGADRRT